MARAKKRNTDITSHGGLRTGPTRHGTMISPQVAKAAQQDLEREHDHGE
jgi:hypothetical protein